MVGEEKATAWALDEALRDEGLRIHVAANAVVVFAAPMGRIDA
jgi:hypothetical protein